MAVFKCKMCGANLAVSENQSVVTCGYCGIYQTLPRLDSDKKIALFTRANNLRIKSEFDKAAGIYESIIAEFRDEAEAYWGLVLCKYGIEYVDDGKGSRIPTCHRTLPTSIMDDDDFNQACEYADITAKNVYRDEAKVIDKIQKKILNIALNESPYDIFICYKENDDITGERTQDSLIAQDIYAQLIKDGYKVFYARVTLRQVAGTEYEPYIYAALSSAKVMLAIGTKHDYYDAVWVKNEWSRFISMMADDPTKALIPCYKNMDAYDMPKEFKNMQALDMGDVTFFGSLIENVERIIDNVSRKTTKETVVINTGSDDVAPLLERGYLFLEDKDFKRADEFFEAVLNKDPKNGKAYLGKLMVAFSVSKFDELANLPSPLNGNNNYEKIMRFADDELKENVKRSNDVIIKRNEDARIQDLYENALEMMEHATTEEMFENAGYMFLEVKDYKDAKQKSDECFERAEIARVELEKQQKIARQKAEAARKDQLYNQAITYISVNRFQESLDILNSLGDYRDSKRYINEIYAKQEAFRAEQERLQRIREEQKRLKDEKISRGLKLSAIVIPVIAVLVAIAIFVSSLIIKEVNSTNITSVAVGFEYLVALKDDGTVVALGDIPLGKSDVSEWSDIKAVVADLTHTIGVKYDGTVVVAGYGDALYGVDTWTDIDKVVTSYQHTIGLKNDGTLVTSIYPPDYDTSYIKDYGQCDVSDWRDIVDISMSDSHTVGVKSDGTVVATKYLGDKKDYCGECEVSGWTDIVQVSASGGHTVGLKSDGTVVATKYLGDKKFYHGQCEVDTWTDIVKVIATGSRTIGLKSDGTVVITEYINNNGDDSYYEFDVSDWKKIEDISIYDGDLVGVKSNGEIVILTADKYSQRHTDDWHDVISIDSGSGHTVGLLKNGTVVAVGSNWSGQCDVSGWSDITAISAGSYHTVGLKSDGTVVAVGDNSCGQCEVSGWKNIVEIFACSDVTIGVKSDGSVVATKYTGDKEFYHGQCDFTGWKDIVSVCSTLDNTIGVKSNGTVVATTYIGDETYYDSETITKVTGWKNIKSISAYYFDVVGLKKDGTVVCSSDYEFEEIKTWKDITAVSISNNLLVGLKSDGTVVVAGNDEYSTDYGQYDVSDWTDIIAVSAGEDCTFGLKTDGTVVSVGKYSLSQKLVEDWVEENC